MYGGQTIIVEPGAFRFTPSMISTNNFFAVTTSVFIFQLPATIFFLMRSYLDPINGEGTTGSFLNGPSFLFKLSSSNRTDGAAIVAGFTTNGEKKLCIDFVLMIVL